MEVSVCDGCGILTACVRGVCSMCRVDGVEQRPTRAERLASAFTVAKGVETFPSDERGRARAAAIRAEDPEGWAEAIGHKVCK